MKAIIELDDVPEFQIGQMARVYFPDSAVMYGKCGQAKGWVSVKDSLPEKNGEYLISTNEGVTSALYERGRRASEWTDYFEGYIDFEPTHWMPLPEPPKEVTGDADTH